MLVVLLSDIIMIIYHYKCILDTEIYCLNELIINLQIYMFNAFFYVFEIIIF